LFFCAGDSNLWNVTHKCCLFALTAHTNVVTALKWGGEGLIYTASRDTTIICWDAKDGKVVRQLKGHGHWVNTLALSNEYATRTGAFDHKAIAPANDEEGKRMARERYDVAMAGQPERLVSGSDDFTMFLWTPETSKSPTRRMTGHVQLINHVVFSPDTKLIASASFDKAVKLWDGKTGEFIATMRGHVGPVYQIAWSADSRMVVSGSKDSTLKVWSARTRKLELDLPGHADEVFAVDWSPIGTRAASGGKDKMLRLWRH
jgi:ribosome assembly protein 4|tara:strand:+ start:19 stop:798 length:780 start_codon:yes stop_codon:yes gene_type:complete